MTARDDFQAIAARGQFLGSRAWADVFLERCRQVDIEGFHANHDDEHTEGQLAMAAACYVLPDAVGSPSATGVRALSSPLVWPWEWRWFKRGKRRRDLVKAAALLIAEIERVDRSEERIERRVDEQREASRRRQFPRIFRARWKHHR